MLLTISTTHSPATDLGWLLHKRPEKIQTFDLPCGAARVFYTEATDTRCTAALVVDVDPVGLVRRRSQSAADAFSLRQYVNDRPYVASSFMSVAISRVFGSALAGRCKDRPELVDAVLPLEARLAVTPCRGGAAFLHTLFEPLGYEVEATPHALDDRRPEWGDSHCFTVTLRGQCRVRDLLTHLYVLIPVLDNEKHYWVGEDELEKLLQKGDGWLAEHPAREAITTRYLKHQRTLTREAIARLAEEDQVDAEAETAQREGEEASLEASIAKAQAGESVAVVSDASSHVEPEEREPTLNEQRLASVLAALRGSGAKTVVDLGCGEGKLLRLLLKDKIAAATNVEAGGAVQLPRFERIAGVDVSIRTLQMAAARLKLEQLSKAKRERVELMQGSLMYRDARLHGFDAATCVEVIEHLDPPRLAAFERVLFEFARPATVIITTPNREYNVRFETLPPGRLRHRDHRFEWTRSEFECWARRIGERFGYQPRFQPIGPLDAEVGSPTQMAVFVAKV